MKNKFTVNTQALSIAILILAGIVLSMAVSNRKHDFFRSKPKLISMDIAIDDFKFMNHSVLEGNQIKTIMEENHIKYHKAGEDTGDIYVEQDDHDEKIMCLSEEVFKMKDSDKPGKSWISGYVASDDNRVTISIYKNQVQVDSFYDGPIHIGDSIDEVKEKLSIPEIMTSGALTEEKNRHYYTCASNLGMVTLKVSPYTGFEDYYKYENEEAYLAAGNTMNYHLKFSTYLISVTFDKDAKVSQVAVVYDPDHVLENAGL